ncbi:conserved hypothetical protein [Histoplasma capsulatum G186AR]|uniref:Copper acquisition factor BIM1-like domain-containing protein n=2 Tax=Ajellomyces capsulatus TaxID=5037 RepID=C0NB10_AJECG|nr:uncharacterized protein HCBG_00306 [Histoplasma capsulatum G186AR]EEH10851.1 conserved hypothetical protein [Histoplasma capsulatum G186AR]KAG5288725.1 hypothetical protein I7I52_12305 [Histoplasma capsulatum]QSS71301.1 hypothetical protein I7I50_02091 [Histoplasma capsulatum G186AR]
MTRFIVSLALLLQLVSAHFSIKYPFWRGNSYTSQWTRPCGGVNVTTNRTEWPLGGGSLLITPSHSWSITFVNLGIGSDDTVIFNISMIEGFNQTGNGAFCFPKIPIPQGLGLTAGSNASIQVVQVNEHGSALYNCADITFSANATLLSTDLCTNSSGIGWKPLGAETALNNTSPKPGAGSMLAIDKSIQSLGLGAIIAILFWNLYV